MRQCIFFYDAKKTQKRGKSDTYMMEVGIRSIARLIILLSLEGGLNVFLEERRLFFSRLPILVIAKMGF